MTSKKADRTCDNCGKDAKGQVYRLQISQRSNEDTPEGTFTKCDNDADMCHDCFLAMCKNGFKPRWTTLRKEGSKWVEVDPQEKLVEPIDYKKLAAAMKQNAS